MGAQVKVRASDVAGALGDFAPPVQNGVTFSGMTGRYIEVCVSFHSDGTNPTPVLCDLTLSSGIGTFSSSRADGKARRL